MERRRPIDQNRNANDRRLPRFDRRSCLERRLVAEHGGERRGGHNARRFSVRYWLRFCYHMSLSVERRLGAERREFFDRRMQARRGQNSENLSTESILTRAWC